ncbi:MAG: hypothetical protein WCK01_02805 [Candidatus Uhrbacteria bacterium]
MTQDAAANDLSHESLPNTPSPEAVEISENPELVKALEGDDLEGGHFNNLVNLAEFKKKRAEESINTLSGEEAKRGVNPFSAKEFEAANDNAIELGEKEKKVFVDTVAAIMGETPKPPEQAKQAVIESRTVVVGEPMAEVAPESEVESESEVEVHNEEAQDQRVGAEEVMKENHKAMLSFVDWFNEEHKGTGVVLALDQQKLELPKDQLKLLTDTERMYMAVLNAKYHAGDSAHAHALAMEEVANETDPKKRSELAKHAFDLSEITKLKEQVATILNDQYMGLPEITAMLGATNGDSTGSSMGGEGFSSSSESSGGSGGPRGGGPGGPSGPEGPKGPDDKTESAAEKLATFEQCVGKLRQLYDSYVAALSNPAELKALRRTVINFAASVHPDRQKDSRINSLSPLANQLLDSFKNPSKMQGRDREQFLQALEAFESSVNATTTAEAATEATSETKTMNMAASAVAAGALASEYRTGASMGGDSFDKIPDAKKTVFSSGGRLYNDVQSGGPAGPAALKGVTGEKPHETKHKVGMLDGWLNKNFKSLWGFIGRDGGGSSGGGGGSHSSKDHH